MLVKLTHQTHARDGDVEIRKILFVVLAFISAKLFLHGRISVFFTSDFIYHISLHVLNLGRCHLQQWNDSVKKLLLCNTLFRTCTHPSKCVCFVSILFDVR